jgi:CubicO group peptidase (beta-lactamase class C family)
VTFLAAYVLPAAAQVQSTLSTELRQKIDRATDDVFTKTGAPSASVAVVKGSQIVCLQAYGVARLDPQTPARPEMRGGMWLRVYRVTFPQKTLRVWTYQGPNGKLEQYQVAVQ